MLSHRFSPTRGIKLYHNAKCNSRWSGAVGRKGLAVVLDRLGVRQIEVAVAVKVVGVVVVVTPVVLGAPACGIAATCLPVDSV